MALDNPLLIFDCDGVLIDSEAIYLDEEFKFLASRGVEIERAQYVREFMALPIKQWRAKLSNLLIEQTGQSLTDDEFHNMKAIVRQRIYHEVQPIAGVENMLAALAVPACVASSTAAQYLPGKLERTNLAQFFGDGVFSSDLVENGKPAPDLFLYAAKQLGGNAAVSIVVEDSANGVKAGKAANMLTIGFAGGGHCYDGHAEMLMAAGADIVVHHHDELLQWLKNNTGAIAS